MRNALGTAGRLAAGLGVAYTGVFVLAGLDPVLAVRGALANALPLAATGTVALRLARSGWLAKKGAAKTAAALLGLVALAVGLWFLLIALDTWNRSGAVRGPQAELIVWQTVMVLLIHLTLGGFGVAGHQADQAQEARARAERAEALRARAELHLLRSQLNPHFILNVLHALLGLVRRDPEKAETVLERLGDLLRFGIEVAQRGTDRVAFREEWSLVCSYLELEQVRLGDRLALELDAAPDTLLVAVPPFSLHPLVENAIVHAIASRGSGGRLRVTARREAGFLRLEVEDDGPGAEEDAIRASPRAGLRLLRERLLALYGGRARLAFGPNPGGGLRACLQLPEEGLADAA